MEITVTCSPVGIQLTTLWLVPAPERRFSGSVTRRVSPEDEELPEPEEPELDEPDPEEPESDEPDPEEPESEGAPPLPSGHSLGKCSRAAAARISTPRSVRKVCGSRAVPVCQAPCQISRCRCGVVLAPELPTSPMVCPAETVSPTCTWEVPSHTCRYREW